MKPLGRHPSYPQWALYEVGPGDLDHRDLSAWGQPEPWTMAVLVEQAKTWQGQPCQARVPVHGGAAANVGEAYLLSADGHFTRLVTIPAVAA